MTVWLLACLQAFESGFWLGQVGFKRRQLARTRERLIWGRKPATALPFIDTHLRQGTQSATRTQVRVATGAVKAVQWLAHTRAFELVVLKFVQLRWPQGRRLSTQIRLPR